MREDLINLACIHEMAESEIGDIVSERGKVIDRSIMKSKHDQERVIIRRMLKMVSREELSRLNDEFLDQSTPTARFLKELDKLETALQALFYEEAIGEQFLDEWYENASLYLKTPDLKKIFGELLTRRGKIKPGH